MIPLVKTVSASSLLVLSRRMKTVQLLFSWGKSSLIRAVITSEHRVWYLLFSCIADSRRESLDCASNTISYPKCDLVWIFLKKSLWFILYLVWTLFIYPCIYLPLNPFDLLVCLQQVNLVLDDGRSLGLMIRGGAEYALGIYITGVDQGSAAECGGLKVSLYISLTLSVLLPAHTR